MKCRTLCEHKDAAHRHYRRMLFVHARRIEIRPRLQQSRSREALPRMREAPIGHVRSGLLPFTWLQRCCAFPAMFYRQNETRYNESKLFIYGSYAGKCACCSRRTRYRIEVSAPECGEDDNAGATWLSLKRDEIILKYAIYLPLLRLRAHSLRQTRSLLSQNFRFQMPQGRRIRLRRVRD